MSVVAQLLQGCSSEKWRLYGRFKDMNNLKDGIQCECCPKLALAWLDDKVLCVECIAVAVWPRGLSGLEHRMRPLDVSPLDVVRIDGQ